MATGFKERATIYVEASNGEYTTVAKTNLRCNMKHVTGGTTVGARAEFAAIRHFMWDSSYYLPEDCEILIKGKPQRWNPNPNTMATIDGSNGNPDYKMCDVTEVKAATQ